MYVDEAPWNTLQLPLQQKTSHAIVEAVSMQFVFHEAIFDKKCTVRESSISMYEEANQLDIYTFSMKGKSQYKEK